MIEKVKRRHREGARRAGRYRSAGCAQRGAARRLRTHLPAPERIARARLRRRAGVRHRAHHARRASKPRSIPRARRSIPPRPRSSASPPTCRSRKPISTAVTAQIEQREAAVRQIEVDLRNSEINSPVDGVVVQRNVELGQTVAASLQAPTLFLIADDLRRMEIAANIDETDVGRIKPGQRVDLHRHRLSRPHLRGQRQAGAARLADRAECRDLHHHHLDRESAARIAARHDRQSADRDRAPRRMSCASRTPPCAGARRRSCRKPRRRSRAGSRHGRHSARRQRRDAASPSSSKRSRPSSISTAAQTKEIDAAIADMRKSFRRQRRRWRRIRRAASAAAPHGRSWKSASPPC